MNKVIDGDNFSFGCESMLRFYSGTSIITTTTRSRLKLNKVIDGDNFSLGCESMLRFYSGSIITTTLATTCYITAKSSGPD